MRKVDGKPIAVVRVFPSADSPHIVRGTGAVYLRSSKGREPVDDHRTLLELARRGQDAEDHARRRLATLPGVGWALRPPDFRPPGVSFGDIVDVRYIVRAAPLTVTPAFSEWPLTRRAAGALVAVADEILPASRVPHGREAPWVEPFGRGMVIRGSQKTGIGQLDRVTVVADSGGVVGVAVSRGNRDGTVRRSAALGSDLLPLTSAVTGLLKSAEAIGRAAIDVWLELPKDTDFHEQQLANVSRELRVSREITVPAGEEDVRTLTLSCYRELQRTAGMPSYEDERPD